MKTYTILHTIEGGGPGGAETVVLNLATRLNPKRFRSVVLLPPGPWLNPRLKEQGIPVIEVSWKGWWDPRGPLAMIRAVREHNVDLIHSHLPDQNFYSCIAGLATGCRTLVTYHGPVEFQDAESLRGKLKLGFVRRTADRAIVVCHMVKAILQKHRFPEEMIAVVYNGIDPAPYVQPGKGALRAELGLGAREILVGMIANFRQTKGYDVYVRACAEIQKKIPNVTFIAVGDINDHFAAPIKALHQQLSLGDRFRFLGFRSDVNDILKELDVFVLASTSEGMPLSILEAMASGKAIVATRCGGIPEVVDHGQTGLLVPASDYGALAEAVGRLIADRSEALRLGASAQIKFQKDFTLGGMIEQYERLYLSRLEHC
jgi:glycosyltransferase involved in cell wall biosynthesis